MIIKFSNIEIIWDLDTVVLVKWWNESLIRVGFGENRRIEEKLELEGRNNTFKNFALKDSRKIRRVQLQLCPHYNSHFHCLSPFSQSTISHLSSH